MIPFKGTFVFFPSWKDLLCEPRKKKTQILRLKHKLAALQRSAEELFVCCYGIEQSMHLFFVVM